MKRNILAFLALSALLLMPQPAQALGDLTITPWRIVLQARDRSAGIELLNTSNETHTYRMNWILLKATSHGTYEPVSYDKAKDKDPHSVPNMIVFSPRQVTIEPHGEQIVRLSLRRPADLPPGEYRAHLTFVRMADNRPPPAQDPNDKTMSLALNVNLGFSIPVIVRQGDDKSLKVTLTNPKLQLQGNSPVLKLDITRLTGTFSTYGEVHAFWQSPRGGEKEIGMINNVALFPELKTRTIEIPIKTKDNIAGGTLRVVYTGKYESDGVIWDEKKFSVGAK